MIRPISEFEKRQRDLMFSIRAPYNSPCRMDNWNEDLFMFEEKTAVANYKRDRCQLVLQKTRKMFRNLTKSVQLSHCLGMLRYGENYQIVAPDVPYEGTKSKTRPVYLAGLVTEAEIDTRQEFSHGSAIVGSLEGTPCVRNAFRIVGCDRNKTGEPVNYGDDFYLQIADDAEIPLYIQCENSFIELGFHLHPRLTRAPNSNCRFKILYYNPNLRFEHVGSLVRANDRIIIQHVATGRNLTVENSIVKTFFGTEYMISCHTYKDTHKMETAGNIWKIVGEDLPNMNAAVRAARGEDIPEELIK